jgi:hypothetical protein
LKVWQKICERRIAVDHRRQHTFWKNIDEESMLSAFDPGQESDLAIVVAAPAGPTFLRRLVSVLGTRATAVWINPIAVADRRSPAMAPIPDGQRRFRSQTNSSRSRCVKLGGGVTAPIYDA